MAKSGMERTREYRERKAKGETRVTVETLEWQLRAQGDLIRALELRIEALEGRPESNLATKNNALAQLRAQIAAVPPIREVPISRPVVLPQTPAPYGEWDPA